MLGARGHRRVMFDWRADRPPPKASPLPPGRRCTCLPQGRLFSFFTTQGIILKCLEPSGFHGLWNPRRLGQWGWRHRGWLVSPTWGARMPSPALGTASGPPRDPSLGEGGRGSAYTSQPGVCPLPQGRLGDLGQTPVLSGLQRPSHTRSRAASDDDLRARCWVNELVNCEGGRVSAGKGWLWTESHCVTPGGAVGEVEAALVACQAQCWTLSTQGPA